MADKLNLKFTGVALMVVGVGLVYQGYDMSGSFGSQLNHAFSGTSGNAVMIRYIGGAAGLLLGLFLYTKSK